MEFNIHEAKTHFSQILARVQAGEEVVIAKAGEPIARIVPIRRHTLRVPGTEKGVVWMAKVPRCPCIIATPSTDCWWRKPLSKACH